MSESVTDAPQQRGPESIHTADDSQGAKHYRNMTGTGQDRTGEFVIHRAARLSASCAHTITGRSWHATAGSPSTRCQSQLKGSCIGFPQQRALLMDWSHRTRTSNPVEAPGKRLSQN